MRISIQQDFTLGGVVHFFDSAKKGYITVEDIKGADTMSSLDQFADEDFNDLFRGSNLTSPTNSQLNNSTPATNDRIDY